jgi:hypothetical protein
MSQFQGSYRETMGRDAQDRNGSQDGISGPDHPFAGTGAGRKTVDGWTNHLSIRFRGPFWKSGLSMDTVVKPIGETVMAAAAAVSELIRTEKLAPQLKRRLDRADARRTELRMALDAIALDAELGEPGAAERFQELRERVGKATDEVSRLEAALAIARARDVAEQAETEISELEAALTRYEGFAAARGDAVRDQLAAIEAAKEAARRYQAATSLLNMPPAGTTLPRGFTVGRGVDLTVETVEAENTYILGIVKSQVHTVVAFKRGEEAA